MLFIIYYDFPAYEDRVESKIDQIQTHTSIKSDKFIQEAPPLHCRVKQKQQLERNRNPITAKSAAQFRDGTATDTDSDYEYVSNPMKKQSKTIIHKLDENPGGMQQIGQHKEHNSICEKSSPHDCSHKRNGNNDGYMNLKREHVEPASENHEYQKLIKETMEPSSAFFRSGQNGGEKRHQTY